MMVPMAVTKVSDSKTALQIRSEKKGEKQNLDRGIIAVQYTKDGTILGGNNSSVLSENQQGGVRRRSMLSSN